MFGERRDTGRRARQNGLGLEGEGASMKNWRRVTRDEPDEVISGDPWTWSGGTVACRWCNGSWNHEDDCAWLTGRRQPRT